jgi:hypothetical protein
VITLTTAARAVKCRAGTANDLYALHVCEADLTHVFACSTLIESAEPHAIDHDEQVLVEFTSDPANRNELDLLPGTPHVKARHQLKNVIERLQPEGGDSLRCEDGD